MAGYTAIANVSESLVGLLRDRIRNRDGIIDLAPNEIAVVSPDDVGTGGDVRLGLYLYEVSQYGTSKNDGLRRVGDDTLQHPPIQLELSYLMTAYPAPGRDDSTAAAQEQQTVLGLAMQILDANATLQDDDLTGELAADGQLHATLVPQSTAEILALWKTFRNATYHPSVTYRLSPVLIDSTTVRTVPRVRETDIDVSRHE